MKYDSQITKHGLVTVNEYVSDKYDLIHKQLYNNALDKYIEEKKILSLMRGDDIIYNTDNYMFVEVPDPEYQKPSSVYVISRVYPFTKELVSLKPYWSNYQDDLQSGNIKNIHDLMIDEESLLDAKIKSIDYVRGYVVMYSKTTDREFIVSFDYLTGDTEIDKESTLYNTFMYKLKNKIFKR